MGKVSSFVDLFRPFGVASGRIFFVLMRHPNISVIANSFYKPACYVRVLINRCDGGHATSTLRIQTTKQLRLFQPAAPHKTTMSILEKSADLLKEALLKGNRPVSAAIDFCTPHTNRDQYTYKLLSRSLDVHVSDARKLLYSFYLKHKDEVEPTYIILGRQRDCAAELSIKVTKSIGEQDSFEKVDSIEIYALSAKNLSVDEIVQNVRPELEKFEVSKEKLKQWGVIDGPEFNEALESLEVGNNEKATSRALASEAVSPSSSGGTTDSKKKTRSESKAQKSFPDMGLASTRMLAKYNNTDKPAKNVQPALGRSFTKPSSSSVKSKNTRGSKAEPSSTEVIEDGDLNDEQFIEKEKKLKEERERKQKSLESMFDDDDGDDDDNDNDNGAEMIEDEAEAVQQPEALEPEAHPNAVESHSKNADLEGIFDSSFSQSQSQSEAKSEPNISHGAAKTEMTSYYDADGYLVTNVEASRPKPKARAATVSSKAEPPAKKAKAEPKQQSSLMNFFGKKKKS